jgi:hypothetical protein
MEVDLWLCLVIPSALSCAGALFIIVSYHLFPRVSPVSQEERLGVD